MSTVKYIIAFAVVVGCFSTMYPRFIHPFIKRAFGSETPKAESGDKQGQFRPPMPHMPSRDGQDIRSHMRPGPHPGMRAAADMQKQHGSQGSGRGMMGVVLPMYAVGIVLYLVYTLVKVFNKRDDYKNKRTPYRPRESSYDRMYDRHDESRQDDRRRFSDRVDNILGKDEGHRELEDLMCKADDKTITADEMRVLQERLADTEKQMASILKAMQLVQNKVPDVIEEKAAKAREEKISDVTGKDSKETVVEKSSDSSPDMDSFEIVKNGSSSGSNVSSIRDEEASPSLEAETIQSKSVEETTDAKADGSQPTGGDEDVKNGNEEKRQSETEEKETVEILKDKESEEKEGGDVRKRQARDFQD